jgi:hypothetical protein
LGDESRRRERDAIKARLGYLEENKVSQVKTADAREFFDNLFVGSLERAGFFKSGGLSKP